MQSARTQREVVFSKIRALNNIELLKEYISLKREESMYPAGMFTDEEDDWELNEVKKELHRRLVKEGFLKAKDVIT